MKSTPRWFLAIWLLSGSLCVGSDATAPTTTIAHCEQELNREQQRETAQRQQIVNMIAAMVTTMKDYDASARNDSGISGLGRIEQLRFRAERYSAERRIRKNIAKDLDTLYTTVQQWQATENRIRECRQQLKMEKRIQAIKQAAAAAQKNQSEAAMDIESIEYYTLKKAATLPEVSALPEVYGDNSAWRYLYDANRDKIAHPNAAIPAGTTLVVPNLKTKNKFINLD
ncbi:MAG: hypothetical protein PHQ27_08575 [Victivallales bacterium]|nr:hypothetical protein [Victivallales bacterium]